MINHGQGPASDSLFDEIKKILEMKDCLEKYEALLQIVPDDYLTWQKYFLISPPKYLEINKKALEANPKSYSAWLFRSLKTEDFDHEEDRLTRLLLKYDPRNFHCWNYRRAKKLPLIYDYFNYSALHDLIRRGGKIDFKSIIYTDPFYEGGYLELLLESNKVRLFDAHFIVSAEKCIRSIFINSEIICEPKINTLVWKCEMKFNKNDEIKVVCDDLILEGKYSDFFTDLEFISEIIKLEPTAKCPYLVKLQHTKDLSERKKLKEVLKSLDPIRSIFYESLEYCNFIRLKNIQ